MYLISSDISHVHYDTLLNYVLENCDEFTVRIPKYTVDDCVELSESIRNSTKLMYDVYFDNACNFADTLFGQHIISTRFSNEYCSSCYGDTQKIYRIRLNQEVIEVLQTAEHLFGWKYPFLPEDPCFYVKGKCLIETISHEGFWRLFSEDKSARFFLRKIRAKFRMSSYDAQ